MREHEQLGAELLHFFLAEAVERIESNFPPRVTPKHANNLFDIRERGHFRREYQFPTEGHLFKTLRHYSRKTALCV